MMKLCGMGPTRSLRARWALQELDLEFEFAAHQPLLAKTITPTSYALIPRESFRCLLTVSLYSQIGRGSASCTWQRSRR